jgi:tRNA-Thr(GGU) m(6)t(6)A37 methyltransferase TsaA
MMIDLPEEPISFRPIGVVRNGFDKSAPPQTIAAEESRIILDPDLADGLTGLRLGERLLVSFFFDRSEGFDLRQHPRGDKSRPARGVFALRSPRRPNPIGITQVELLAIEGNELRVRGLDALNGTPVLDIKPADTREIEFPPIGKVHSPYAEPEGAPIQVPGGEGVEATIEIYPEYVAGLDSVEGFSHIIVLYHFHLAGKAELTVHPFLDDQARGIFATRAPCRPNAIGLSVVHLVRVEGNLLHVEDLDIIDLSPVLDIKPYVPEFDARDVDSIGWLEGKAQEAARRRADARFRPE